MENKTLIKKYSDIMPRDLKYMIEWLNEPKDDLDWALINYIFQNTGQGIVTLGKVSSYFSLDQKECFERLNNLAGFWFSQYLNNSGYKTYYSYEMNKLSADIIISMMDVLAYGSLKRQRNKEKDEIITKLKAEKYDKIKIIVDNIGDSERNLGEDEPLISASTALNTITEIWRTIYEIRKKGDKMVICENCGKNVNIICSEGMCVDCHYDINGELCKELIEKTGLPMLRQLKGEANK